MKPLLISEAGLNRLFKSFVFFVLMVFAFSCKKDGGETNTNFLKGYWTYLNGAEAYYDGVSDYAKGTKVPADNTGFDFVVGENYWQDLRKTSDTTWTLNHIVRTSNGQRTYNATTFKKTGDNTIMSTISGYGNETLTRRQ